MTRFWITLEQAVEFVIRCIQIMQGGEIFVPKLPSMRIVDLARSIAPECRTEIVGIRPGEKLHEVLLTEDESRRALEFDDFYVVMPTSYSPKDNGGYLKGGKPMTENFRYGSDNNNWWLSVEEMHSYEDENEPEFHSLREAIG
jgi:UDP-N-acetylglucosamine 4,6-dehydratase